MDEEVQNENNTYPLEYIVKFSNELNNTSSETAFQ